MLFYKLFNNLSVTEYFNYLQFSEFLGIYTLIYKFLCMFLIFLNVLFGSGIIRTRVELMFESLKIANLHFS